MRLHWQNKDQKHSSKAIPQKTVFGKGESKAQLALCDNLDFLEYLVEKGTKIDMIYIDPPFLSGKGYSQQIVIDDELLVKQTYEDRGRLEDYMSMIYPRLKLMHKLLSDKGTLFFHGDRRIIHHVKIVMDEIFGSKNMVNEIIWTYTGGTDRSRGFAHKHDTILMYAKTENFTFNPVHIAFSKGAIKRFNKVDENGRKYKENKLKDGRITRTFMKEQGKICPDYWHLNIIVPSHNEHTGYRTQKPKELLKRIILASTNQGDIVADFFMGSSTTGQVALENKRYYIGTDIGFPAFDTSLLRLLPFGKIETYRNWLERGKASFDLDKTIKNGETSLVINNYSAIELPEESSTKNQKKLSSKVLKLVAIENNGNVENISNPDTPNTLSFPENLTNCNLLTLDATGIVTKHKI